MAGVWSVASVSVDGVKADNGTNTIEFVVDPVESSVASFTVRLVRTGTSCDVVGGLWHVHDNKLYLDKLNLQAAVACEIPEPGSVATIRTGLGLGGLAYRPTDSGLTLSSELVTIELKR